MPSERTYWFRKIDGDQFQDKVLNTAATATYISVGLPGLDSRQPKSLNPWDIVWVFRGCLRNVVSAHPTDNVAKTLEVTHTMCTAPLHAMGQLYVSVSLNNII